MMKKRHQQYTRIGAILFVAFFGHVIFSADKGTMLPFIQRLYAFPYGDKVGHLLLLAVLTLASNSIISKRIAVSGRTLFVGSLVVCIFISLEEFSQIIFSTRTFDLLDLMSSYAGIVLGDSTVRFLSRKKRTVSLADMD